MAQGVVEMQIRAAEFLFTTPVTRPTSIMRFFQMDRWYFSSLPDVFPLSLSPFLSRFSSPFINLSEAVL